MNQEKYVLFKGTSDGVTLVFDKNADFAIIKEQLEKKVQDAGHFFNEVKTSIAFCGREFSHEEEQELIDTIIENTTMEIVFVKLENIKSEEVERLKEELAKREEIPSHNVTHTHKGSFRNGQSISIDGSLIIIGDINPGAEVSATGNIIVLGQLKGLAHAGCNGDEEAIVSALYMAPVQLRIAGIITIFPDEKKHGKKPPEYAFVKDGTIFVENLM
ncbi:MAG: septum site-determining protein MinC [Bacillota bacterium]